MRFVAHTCAQVLVAVTAHMAPAAAQLPQRATLQVARCAEPPTIDGGLDDPVWKLARPSDVFVQVEPREGEAPSERTEIRALFDADCLYLAVR
ncbi:MAG TPA: hypothetical protein VFZ65_22210, partial [Planctomycetota bacterium]|nr:hypothetical protein [Planctomycetota bacterium]